VTRRESERLSDVLAAIAAIREYLAEGDLGTPMVFDAVRMRLIEIGEAVKALDQDLLDREQSVPWRLIAGMRDRLAHRYFESEHSIIEITVTEELDDLEGAIRRLLV